MDKGSGAKWPLSCMGLRCMDTHRQGYELFITKPIRTHSPLSAGETQYFPTSVLRITQQQPLHLVAALSPTNLPPNFGEGYLSEIRNNHITHDGGRQALQVTEQPAQQHQHQLGRLQKPLLSTLRPRDHLSSFHDQQMPSILHGFDGSQPPAIDLEQHHLPGQKRAGQYNRADHGHGRNGHRLQRRHGQPID